MNLLIRLHVAGFFWGDCSLSNTLFRRDAGRAGRVRRRHRDRRAASPAQRRPAQPRPDRCGGEHRGESCFDVTAEGLVHDMDPVDAAEELRRRYDGLWSELTSEVAFAPDQRYRIEERLQWLNSSRLRRRRGRGRGRRAASTGSASSPASSNPVTTSAPSRRSPGSRSRRTRRGDCSATLAATAPSSRRRPVVRSPRRSPRDAGSSTSSSRPSPRSRGAARRLEPAELFHQVLDHRWYLSEAAGHDVGLSEAVQVLCRHGAAQCRDARAGRCPRRDLKRRLEQRVMPALPRASCGKGRQ